jgi:hypothetical protein
VLAAVVLVACAPHQTPETPGPPADPQIVRSPGSVEPTAPAQHPARLDLPTETSPSTVIVSNDRLVWIDTAGSIWTMPTPAPAADTSASARELSDQRSIGFAFQLATAGDAVYATTRAGLVHVALPSGPVTSIAAALPGAAEEVISDGNAIFVTLFKRDEIIAITPPATARTLGKLRRGVLAEHGDTLYAISYSTGALVAIPKAGGKPRPIARGFVRPTALAADATHAYVYTERDRTLRSVDLATGAQTRLADGLVNSDDLVADGRWLYTYSWDRPGGARLVRVAKDASTTETLADDLASPSHIAIAADAIYVTSRDQNKIVRLRRSQ